MYLHTLIVFAILFFRSEKPPADLYDVRWGVAGILAYWLILMGAAWTSRFLTLRAWRRGPIGNADPHARFHQAQVLLNAYLVVGFGLLAYVTPWPDFCYAWRLNSYLRVLSDLCTFLPYLIGCGLLWAVSYPVERVFRGGGDVAVQGNGVIPSHRHTLSRHLLLNLRFQVLVIAVPMFVILFASNVIDGHRGVLRRTLFGWTFSPDVVLGLVVLLVFVMSPLLLRMVWNTKRLESGPTRVRLESLCRRIGLKYRDILVWKTDGMMINAAVMGLLKPVRYVLLSDGLLQSMDEHQIEAVFGHEAGHVRRRHIEFFLVFSFVAMLAVSGVLELVALYRPTVSETEFEVIGGMFTAGLWAFGFGFVSRRFEREADCFGARCAMPSAAQCAGPCSVHRGPEVPARLDDDRVCASGAQVLVSALDRVALLNGVEHEESSWLHASIGYRMRFLTSLAADPSLARRFRRTLMRIKAGLLILAVGGGLFAAYYVGWRQPALMSWRPQP